MIGHEASSELEVIGLEVTWLPAFTGTIELLYVQNGDELRMDAAN
jgi:hypothetical protein